LGGDLGRVLAWLHRRAENVVVILLAVMFLAFLIQVIGRYAFDFPIGWTTELTLISWLWLVLFGASFVITEGEEIRFDLVYGALGKRARLAAALFTHGFTIALYVLSFPAVLDYVLFMKVQKSSYFDIPLNVLYFIYPIFAVATVFRYAALLVRTVRGNEPVPPAPTAPGSGL
jgi:TRAP-type C4-dicarboxylate transport system permease small subunit